MNLTQYFVTNNNIPEFIKSDNGLFTAFVEAYYEWIELQNDSESSSYADVYKAVGNPAYIQNNQEIIVDIDATIDQFVDFFAEEVVPISLEGMKTNPRFFIKKIRELYLAKGTPKSFKLFFKLYYDDEIDVFETRDTVLRASDGKYFSFPTAHFYVNLNQEDVENIDFTLATLEDSDRNNIATLLSGLVVDSINGFSVIKAELSNSPVMDNKSNYWIVDLNNKEYEIRVNPMYTIGTIDVIDGGALFSTNDKMYINSKGMGKRFFGSINQVQQGRVEGIKARSRGSMYRTTDAFEMRNGLAAIGSFYPTAVTKYGEIAEINDVPLRTGTFNTGFDSTNFVDVKVPFYNNAVLSTLPSIHYLPSSSGVNIYGEPYVSNTGDGSGSGFQCVPYSESIGKVLDANLTQTPYFLNDSDIELNMPATILVENSTLSMGDTIAFQTFNHTINPTGFDDDSEIYQLFYHVHRNWYHTDPVDSSIDSERNEIHEVKLPVSWDSERADWTAHTATIQTEKGALAGDVLKPIKDILDSDANISSTIIYEDVILTGIDGGDWTNGGIVYDSDLDGGEDFLRAEDADTRWVDGGPSFDFSRSELHIIGVNFIGQYMDQLEPHHWDKVDSDYSYYDNNQRIIIRHEEVAIDLNNYNLQNDIGLWQDTGHYGYVEAVDESGLVAKVVASPGSALPTYSEWHTLTEDKYDIVLATPFDETGAAPKNVGIPFENVVHQFKRLDISYTLGTVSSLTKKFWTQDGFLSSSYGGTLQDNYYYSDYAYRIKSTVPFYEWKDKFKTLLHPAGMVMSGELVLNSSADLKSDNAEASTYSSDNFGSGMTFDMMQENISMTMNTGINADNTDYKTNPFEFQYTGTVLDASTQTNPINPFMKMQNGNAWWDYEPTGWIHEAPLAATVTGTYANLIPAVEFLNKSSTQDIDPKSNNLHVANNYHWYNRFQNNENDFYKTHARVGVNATRVTKTQFEDSFITEYTAFDSELNAGVICTFSDSDASFKAIDYTPYYHSDSDYFPTYKVPRAKEIKAMMERDLVKAMQEKQKLTWVSEGVTYTDYDAYDKKWNGITPERTFNNEGYVQKLYSSYFDYVNLESRNTNRNKSFNVMTLIDANRYTDSIPYSQDTWQVGDLVWDAIPNDGINTIDYRTKDNVETYKDPAVSMKGRRG